MDKTRDGHTNRLDGQFNQKNTDFSFVMGPGYKELTIAPHTNVVRYNVSLVYTTIVTIRCSQDRYNTNAT